MHDSSLMHQLVGDCRIRPRIFFRGIFHKTCESGKGKIIYGLGPKLQVKGKNNYELGAKLQVKSGFRKPSQK